jgi:hypothetical protein
MKQKNLAIVGASAALLIVTISVVSIWQGNELQQLKEIKTSPAVEVADTTPHLTDDQIDQLIKADSAQRQNNDTEGWKERYQTVLGWLMEPSLDQRLLINVRFSYIDSHPYGGDLVQSPLYEDEFNFNPYGFSHFTLGIHKSVKSPSGKRTLVEYGTFAQELKNGVSATATLRSVRGFFVKEGDVLLDNGVYTESLSSAPHLTNIRWIDDDTISYDIESSEWVSQQGQTVTTKPKIEHAVLDFGTPIMNYEGGGDMGP